MLIEDPEPADRVGHDPAPPRQSSGSRVRPMFMLALAGVIIAWSAGLFGAFVGAKLATDRDDPPRRPSTLGLVVADVREDPLPRLDVPVVASMVGASVVAVSRHEVDGEAVGTGLIISSDGEIITNAHVIGTATKVNVRLPGESEPRVAAVVASDRNIDLALLRVEVTGLTPATLAAPGDVHVGDEVLAVGYALDLDGDPTVTLGIVSALDRALDGSGTVLFGLIQTDAAISAGNSGGPLVNAAGEVIGLNTLVVSDPGVASNGLGFAIATKQLIPEIERLRTQGSGGPAAQGFLGVGLEPRRDGGSGALVTEIVAGSPAERAGLRLDDIVIEVNGVRIDGQAELAATIRWLGPGSEVRVRIMRDGEPAEIVATLVERAPD